MVTETQDGLYLFKIYYPHAGSVEIVGDFTGGVAMHRAGSGWWSATVRVPPGDHTFRYLVNGQSPLPDYAAGGLERDADGMWVSCLHVPERTAAPDEPADGGAPAPEPVAITEEQLGRLRAGEGVELRIGGRSARLVLRAARPAHRAAGREAAGRVPRRVG